MAKMRKTANSRKSNGTMMAIEVSDCLKMPLSTLYRLTKQGKIAGIKFGGKWQYRSEDIERFRLYGYTNNPQSPIPNPSLQHEHTESIEQRRHARINTRLQSRIVLPLRDSSFEGEIRDLSQGGLSFSSNGSRKVLINDPIEFKFALDDAQNTPMELKGRVVYVSEKAIGVAFRQIGDSAKEEIACYVG